MAPDSSAAAATPRSDLSTVQQVISDTQSGIDALTTAAQNFNGNFQLILDESNKLLNTLSAVQPLSVLSISDALAAITPVTTLQTHAQSFDDEFKS